MNWTKENLEELILTIMVGSWVREFIDEGEGKDFDIYGKQLDTFLQLAKKLGYYSLVQDFEGHHLPSDKLLKVEEKIMQDFSDSTFWEELELRLGQRDFLKEASKEEMEKIKKDFWLPDGIQKYYKKYSKEFEKNGIDRLVIQSKKIFP